MKDGLEEVSGPGPATDDGRYSSASTSRAGSAGDKKPDFVLAIGALVAAVAAVLSAAIAWFGASLNHAFHLDDDFGANPYVLIFSAVALVAGVAAWRQKQPRAIIIPTLLIASLIMIPDLVRLGSDTWGSVLEAQAKADADMEPGGANNPAALGETVNVGTWEVTIDVVNLEAAAWASLPEHQAGPGDQLLVVSGVLKPVERLTTVGDPLPRLSIDGGSSNDVLLEPDNWAIPSLTGQSGFGYELDVPVRVHWSGLIPERIASSPDGPLLRTASYRADDPASEDNRSQVHYVALGGESVIPGWAEEGPTGTPDGRGSKDDPLRIGETFRTDAWTIRVHELVEEPGGGTRVHWTVKNTSDTARSPWGAVPVYHYTSDWAGLAPTSDLAKDADAAPIDTRTRLEPGESLTDDLYFEASPEGRWALSFILGGYGSTIYVVGD